MSRAWFLVLTLGICAVARFTFELATPKSEPRQPLSPLRELPMDLFGPGWKGETRALAEDVIQATGTDDHVLRRYDRGDEFVFFYAGYVGGFRENSIHHPEICFPNSGIRLIEKGILEVELEGQDGPIQLNEYFWAPEAPGEPPLYTISTFCYDGHFEAHEWALRLHAWNASFFSVLFLHGKALETRDATRALYRSLLQESVPKLLSHFPLDAP